MNVISGVGCGISREAAFPLMLNNERGNGPRLRATVLVLASRCSDLLGPGSAAIALMGYHLSRSIFRLGYPSTDRR